MAWSAGSSGSAPSAAANAATSILQGTEQMVQLEDAGAEAGVEDRPQRFPATGAARARR